MQAHKRANLQGPKNTKRKRSEAATFDDLLIDEREDTRNDDDGEPEDPLAEETPAEKRIRIGALTTGITGHYSLLDLENWPCHIS